MIYDFKNIETGEVRSVHFGMNDIKDYRGENGEESDKWKRIYYAPNTVIDGNINPFSQQDFLNKTKNAKTYGEMWDLSAEMSQQRADKLGGEDPMRKAAEKKFYKQK